MNETRPQLLDRISALADGLRCRILTCLERQELTVSEVCAVLQLPQSTVSRHLKTLVDAGWIGSRRNGTSRLYHLPLEELDSSTRRLWALARDELSATPTSEQDAQRLQAVLRQRRSRSQEFFSTTAGHWDRLRDEMFGQRFYLLGLLGLVDPDWTVADLGCGTGPLAEALAPIVRRVIAIDESEAMLETARRRLEGFDNVELRRGELESLPLEDASVDAATLVLVLHHLPQPERAVAEVARVLRPGGRFLILDMLPHERHEYQQEMGHVWMGFSETQIERHLAAAGLRLDRFRSLAPDPAARGPLLFAATGSRDGASAARTFARQVDQEFKSDEVSRR